MRQGARKGRSHSHAVKVGNGRRSGRKRTIHHPVNAGRKAWGTRKAPGVASEGLQRTNPSVHGSRSDQCMAS